MLRALAGLAAALNDAPLQLAPTDSCVGTRALANFDKQPWRLARAKLVIYALHKGTEVVGCPGSTPVKPDPELCVGERSPGMIL